MPAGTRDAGDPAARAAYAAGIDPVAYAEIRVGQAIQVHEAVTGGREKDPAAFPAYAPALTLEALSRHVLGVLMDLGWTPPGTGGQGS